MRPKNLNTFFFKSYITTGGSKNFLLPVQRFLFMLLIDFPKQRWWHKNQKSWIYVALAMVSNYTLYPLLKSKKRSWLQVPTGMCGITQACWAQLGAEATGVSWPEAVDKYMQLRDCQEVSWPQSPLPQHPKVGGIMVWTLFIFPLLLCASSPCAFQ